MKEFEKIIGYSAIKQELMQIVDTFKNREKYEKLGASTPSGLMLHGVPGVGKSLMATSLVEASGLFSVTCRKDRPNDDFVNIIRESFEKAKANAPSIIFLDDMDKFANCDEGFPNTDEYVTIQSCIDDVKGKGVFVLATANELGYLPNSLLRAGRFDRIIHVLTPEPCDAEKIIEYYLSKKKVAMDFDIKSIARIMKNHSCAELETVINEAGVHAAFEKCDSIKMEHFMKAAMRIIFDIPISPIYDGNNFSNNDETLEKIAYHEAGHVVIHEILDSGSITLATVYGRRFVDFGGFTSFDHSENITNLKRDKIEILAALAGMASLEQKFGSTDIGASHDLNRAFSLVNNLIINECSSGFHLYGEYGDLSNELRSRQEETVAAEIEKYYRKSKAIIASNMEFLDSVARALMSKKMLSAQDVCKLKAEHEVIIPDFL